MKFRIKCLLSVSLLFLLVACGQEEGNGRVVIPTNKTEDKDVPAAKVGAVLPAWEEGCLDIHSINSGRGECFYYILPDGTTMLVDCAGAPPMELANREGVPSKPNVSVTSGQVIINYIKHFAPSVAGGKLDYFMASHYHGDHIGAWRAAYASYNWPMVHGTTPENGGFLINGLGAVGTEIPITKVLDRGDWSYHPSADYLDSMVEKTDDGGLKRYLLYTNFLSWSAKEYGTVRETLVPGRTDQVVLLHDTDSYKKNFYVRTIAASGDIWTGIGTNVNTTYLPSSEETINNLYRASENVNSCCFHLKYGFFDFFSGGDIQYGGRSTHSWLDIELPISKVLGKLEVMKASHHGTANTNSQELLNAAKPEHVVIGVWNSVQPNPDTIKRFLKANSKTRFFLTNLTDENRKTLTDDGVDLSVFSATGGHIVVRVAPGGRKYRIYVLDDTNQDYKVKAILGPYTAQ